MRCISEWDGNEARTKLVREEHLAHVALIAAQRRDAFGNLSKPQPQPLRTRKNQWVTALKSGNSEVLRGSRLGDLRQLASGATRELALPAAGRGMLVGALHLAQVENLKMKNARDTSSTWTPCPLANAMRAFFIQRRNVLGNGGILRSK